MNKEIVTYIKKCADEVRKEYGYENSIIGENIFKIVRKRGRILFFPLDDEPDLDGFHIKRTIAGQEEAFIYINTYKPVEKNIFCAAHELGHIYAVDEKVFQQFPKAVGIDGEDIINRFAAELLMPESTFCDQVHFSFKTVLNKGASISLDDLLKTIVYLMDYFYVPYKAVIYRLVETGWISSSSIGYLTKYTDKEVIRTYICDGNYTKLLRENNVKDLDGLKEDLSYAEAFQVYGQAKIKKIQRDFEIPSTDKETQKEVEETYIDVIKDNKNGAT